MELRRGLGELFRGDGRAVFARRAEADGALDALHGPAEAARAEDVGRLGAPGRDRALARGDEEALLFDRLGAADGVEELGDRDCGFVRRVRVRVEKVDEFGLDGDLAAEDGPDGVFEAADLEIWERGVAEKRQHGGWKRLVCAGTGRPRARAAVPSVLAGSEYTTRRGRARVANGAGMV